MRSRWPGLAASVVVTVVVSAVTSLAENAATGQDRWPGPLDGIRQHAWYVLGAGLVVSVVLAIYAVRSEHDAGDAESASAPTAPQVRERVVDRDQAAEVVSNTFSGEAWAGVVQARNIEAPVTFWHVTVDLRHHAGTVLRILVAMCGLLLAVVQPRLPLPAPYSDGAAQAGLALLGTVVVLELTVRIRAVLLRRRARAWRAERHLARAAEALAQGLRRQYDQDERLGQLRGQHPIDVAWGPADGSVPDGAESAATIADYFRSVPEQRLVVLGGAGAGKTVFALRLADALLKERRPDSAEPVPAVVSLASWDPEVGLMAWVAARLAADHPQACTPVAGAPPQAVAFHLLYIRRVLPVFDGFDELPEPVRGKAFQQLAASMRDRRYRFVLTSRAPEYRVHVLDQSVFARTEIRLHDLTDAAVAEHLAPPDAQHSRWVPVLKALAGSGRPSRRSRRAVELLRAVLRVPLMVELARVAYGAADKDPSELLGPGRFASEEDVQRHLYDAFVDVAYNESLDVRAVQGGWDPAMARSWAAFLALRLRRVNSQDLAWWELADEGVPRSVLALRYLPAYAATAWAFTLPGFVGSWWSRWLAVPVWVAFLALACVVVALGLGAKGHAVPYQPTAPGRAEVGRALRQRDAVIGWTVSGAALAAGWAGTAVAEVPGWWIMAALSAFALLRVTGRIRDTVWRPADPARAPSPEALLRADRLAALGLGWLTPPKAPDDDPDLPYLIVCLPLAVLAWWQYKAGRELAGPHDWMALAPGVLLAWWLYAIASSAWCRYAVARAWFAATGRLPWRLQAFLRDANVRGVLRQAGGTYRFRHVELRNRLADAAGEERRHVRQHGGRRLRFVRGLAATCAVLALLAAASGPLRQGRLLGPIAAAPPACALLTGEDVAKLMTDAEKKAYHPLVYGFNVRGCLAVEKSPFAPAAQAEVTPVLTAGILGRSSTDAAAATLARDKHEDRGWSTGKYATKSLRTVTGIGDEAYAVESHGYPVASEVHVRAGNLLINTSYEEEFASGERTLQIAAILARDALRRADAGAWVHADAAVNGHRIGQRTLADVPRAAPPKNNRISLYAPSGRDHTQAVDGAVWHGSEPSYLWSLSGVPFVFRAPADLLCSPGGGSVTQQCENEIIDPWNDYLPHLRLDIAAYYCHASCTDAKKAPFTHAIPRDDPPWHHVSGRAPHGLDGTQGTTSYATEQSDHGHHYRMYLSRSLTSKDKTSGERWDLIVWIRAEVDHGREQVAQKIINDIYAQTGGTLY